MARERERTRVVRDDPPAAETADHDDRPSEVLADPDTFAPAEPGALDLPKFEPTEDEALALVIETRKARDRGRKRLAELEAAHEAALKTYDRARAAKAK